MNGCCGWVLCRQPKVWCFANAKVVVQLVSRSQFSKNGIRSKSYGSDEDFKSSRRACVGDLPCGLVRRVCEESQTAITRYGPVLVKKSWLYEDATKLSTCPNCCRFFYLWPKALYKLLQCIVCGQFGSLRCIFVFLLIFELLEVFIDK